MFSIMEWVKCGCRNSFMTLVIFEPSLAMGAGSARFLELFSPSSGYQVFGLIELFKFDDFYEIFLGATVVFLFTAVWWSVLLRRKVREQREQIEQQFARETALQKRYQDLFENANDIIFML